MMTTSSTSTLYAAASYGSFSAFKQLESITIRKPHNASALRYLARCYEKGHVYPVSFERAAELYQKAAALGDDIAMYHLGRLYEAGQGVQKDSGIASQYYYDAAKCRLKQSGSHRAIARLQTLAQESPPQVSMLINLGRCYQHGCGLRKNFNRASELYKQAFGLDPLLTMRMLNITDKLRCLKQIVDSHHLIQGRHKGIEKIKSILRNPGELDVFEQWLEIQKIADQRLGCYAGKLFGCMYRDPLLTRLYAAINSDDESQLRDIEEERMEGRSVRDRAMLMRS